MSLVRYYLTEILGIFWIVEKLWMMERTKIKFRVCVCVFFEDEWYRIRK